VQVECGHTGDAILVTEVLQLRLAPGIDDHVRECAISILGALSGAGSLVLHAEIGQSRIASHRSDELVTLQEVSMGEAHYEMTRYSQWRAEEREYRGYPGTPSNQTL